jgi:DNA polymerase-3 subunit epsilon
MSDAQKVCILDTETTGLAASEGDRIIEIGIVELLDRNPGGERREFYRVVDPERDVPEQSTEVHGWTLEGIRDHLRLIDKAPGRRFVDIADEFIEFIRGAQLVIHNAAFDVGFLDMELRRCNQILGETRYGALEDYVAGIFDSWKYANARFPRQRNSLDALARRFGIDLSKRQSEGHGALLDSQILGDIYLNLTRHQKNIELDNRGRTAGQRLRLKAEIAPVLRPDGAKLPVVAPSEGEREAHRALLERINRESDGECLWGMS